MNLRYPSERNIGELCVSYFSGKKYAIREMQIL